MHDYCVFDYFFFNLVSISGGELHKVHDFLCLTFLSSILSPYQEVSYIKCMILVCLIVFTTK